MDGKIALEEHFALPETQGMSREYADDDSWADLNRRLLDLDDLRLAEMDRHGVAIAILSLNAPGVQAIADVETAVATARRANDRLAEAIRARPDRFAGFAALPMQDPDAAAAELTRSVGELGFKGALVNGFSEVGVPGRVVYYDDPAYRPFWATLEKLDVPFYLHPRDPLPAREPIYDGHPWLLGPVWAFGVETATHALRLISSGLFDRYPRLAIVLGHLGEGLPYNIWRVDHRLAKSSRGMPARRKPGEYLRSNFYLTTSGNFHTPTLASAMREIGSDRLLFSVDYPFEDHVDAATWFDGAQISESDRLKIGRTNAIALFGL
jgi:predicted TIM-barrel fold metal-dependent hydrolase